MNFSVKFQPIFHVLKVARCIDFQVLDICVHAFEAGCGLYLHIDLEKVILPSLVLDPGVAQEITFPGTSKLEAVEIGVLWKILKNTRDRDLFLVVKFYNFSDRIICTKQCIRCGLRDHD